jgi:hypothetical protein
MIDKDEVKETIGGEEKNIERRLDNLINILFNRVMKR